MKTIEFEGKKYEVEDWVNWVAMDSNGSVWAHEDKPFLGTYAWVSESKIQRLVCLKPWETTLTKA